MNKNSLMTVSKQIPSFFGKNGYGKCTVNDILETVEIAKGRFYYYFKSKEEILDAIIDRADENIVERTAVHLNKEYYNKKYVYKNIYTKNN